MDKVFLKYWEIINVCLNSHGDTSMLRFSCSSVMLINIVSSSKSSCNYHQLAFLSWGTGWHMCLPTSFGESWTNIGYCSWNPRPRSNGENLFPSDANVQTNKVQFLKGESNKKKGKMKQDVQLLLIFMQKPNRFKQRAWILCYIMTNLERIL